MNNLPPSQHSDTSYPADQTPLAPAEVGTPSEVGAPAPALPVRIAVALLFVLSLLSCLAAWRMVPESRGSAHFAASITALAALAAVAMAGIRGPKNQVSRLPWLLLAAAMLTRAAGELVWFSWYRSTATNALPLIGSIFFLFDTALVAATIYAICYMVSRPALETGDTREEQRPFVVSLISPLNALILGISLAILLWWFLLERGAPRPTATVTTATATTATGGNPLQFIVVILSLSSLMLAILNRRQSRTIFSVGLMLSGLLLLSIADARLLGIGTKTSNGLFDVLIRGFAPALLGAFALWETGMGLSRSDAIVQEEGVADTGENSQFALALPEWVSDSLVVGVPCLVVLVSAWHFNSNTHTTTVIGRSLLETWWAPVLVFVALIRQAIIFPVARRDQEEVEDLRHNLQSLKNELQQRTHQLSTLHDVTADLSNSLNCEQLVNTALKRTVEALSADAGAIWIRLDSAELQGNEITADSDGSPRAMSNAAFLWRELERCAADRRALDALRTRTATHGDNDNLNGVAQNGAVNVSGGSIGRNWRLARSWGDEKEARHRILGQLHQELDSSGFAQCDALCRGQLAGRELPVAAHVAPIRSKGEMLGTLGIIRNGKPFDSAERALLDALAMEVATALQNAQLYQEASRLADRDSLTDLLNHRAVQQQLNTVLSRAQRTQTEFAVVMMDLNNFKFFNDTYGHPVGDQVLRTVAQCLRDACRGSDVIGRFGGDEFIAVLLDTDEKGAIHVCSRIAARVEEEAYQQANDGRRIPIMLSFGAAFYPHDGKSVMELLTFADSNLYDAKAGGTPMLLARRAEDDAQELRKLKDAGTGGSFGVLDALVTAIDNKDHYTRRHSEDVSQWATLMAKQLGYDEEMQRAVRICGLLHDVGKIAVPDQILRKPGRLNDEEFNIMQQHPVFGALIVKDVPNLTDVLGGVRHHHERYDGKGYPDKLKGDEIPPLGALLAVPDCFSAMTTDRPYRKALSWSEALSEIERGSGTQFDPIMAEAFLEVMARIIAEKQTPQLLDTTEEADGEPLAEGDGVARPRSVMDAGTGI